MLEPETTLAPTLSLWLYTSFIVHITVVVFISSIYGFASRFFKQSFYIYLALGWLINVGYLMLEAFLLLVGPSNWHSLSLKLTTASIGMVSIPFFHRAVQISTADRKSRRQWYLPVVFGSLVVGLSVSAAIWANKLNFFPEHLLFAII